MEPNCKNKFNLDHVYCHPNETNYIRANSSADVLAILKENKQLKAMLLLHLDLIQEQSDQLMSKDKHLASLREENECLKLRLERMDRRLQLKNKVVEPPTPTTSPVLSHHEDKKENILKVKTYSRISNMTSPTSQPTVSSPPPLNSVVEQQSPKAESKYKICDDNNYNVDSNVIGENNGKFITKIILQRVQARNQKSGKYENDVEASQCLSDVLENTASRDMILKSELVCSSFDLEDGFSCGSGEQDRRPPAIQSSHKHVMRHGNLTTKRLYCSREWETEKIDEEFNREESEALKSEVPNLEIPKWTIKDYTGLYAIEGTEDLSDDTFLKRHNKLEIDEKRRKKWDVQRIREQRTIERLKRRHYKKEVNEAEPNPVHNSFYPSSESIKYIQITDDLPVNAFGENIPIITDKDFLLPWSELSPRTAATTTASDLEVSGIGGPPGPNTMLFVLKKRRRQHSQNSTVHLKRPNRKLVIKN